MGMMYRFLGVMELRSSIKEHESIFLTSICGISAGVE
jgi:hypothetical protein